jgi:uncharacterized membrane protein
MPDKKLANIQLILRLSRLTIITIHKELVAVFILNDSRKKIGQIINSVAITFSEFRFLQHKKVKTPTTIALWLN